MTSSNNKQQQFIQDLVQFYRNKGIVFANPSQFVARLNGKNVDLSELYSSVMEYGGSYKVNQLNLWDEIYFKLFNTNYVGANFAVALRQIYNRYLLQYEKSCSGGNANSSEQWNDDEEDESAIFSNTHHGSTSWSNPIVKQQYDDVKDVNGQIHNDNKLYCSLLSGLPNELNFAFNVATILSNCHRFDWSNDYKFINVLVESTKAYCCICDYVEEEMNFGRKLISEEDEILELENIIRKKLDRKNEMEQTIKMNGKSTTNESSKIPDFGPKIDFIEHKCNCHVRFWHQVCFDEELLNFVFDKYWEEMVLDYSFRDIPQKMMKRIEHRISTIADIIRNISFTFNPNNQNRVALTPLLEFLILLLKSDNVRFVNISLDILSNIAPALSFSISKSHDEKHNELLNILFKNVVHIAMNSLNIHDTTKAFEVMARYISPSHTEANQLLETHFRNKPIYERITHLLTCHYDISLLLALLEFCLILSESRPHILIKNDSRTFIKILVNLLNCQAAQHFTTGALDKIKIIDTRPSEAVPDATKIIPDQRENVMVANSNNIKSGQMTNPIQINLSSLDNESFAINWLKTTYDEAPLNNSLKVNEIYAEYVKHCCRNLRRNVIAAQSFNFLLKRCFPHCNINQISVDGLTLRTQATIVTDDQLRKSSTPATNQMMSPILKAHLSTPPKAQINDSIPPPIPSTTNTTSTLIKSLLANKLRNNQQQMVSAPVATPPNTPNETPKNSDPNTPKNVIITNNPATSFALTTPTFNFGNNIIVPTSVATPGQPQMPGSQQFFLVRTIIAGPGQQGTNGPVRLLLPASMITQQPRLATPNINGVAPAPIPSNNVASSITKNQTPTAVTQMAFTPSTQPNIIANNQNQAAVIASSPSIQIPPQNKNSIANSSPLLNVLLDKGKLPEFPNQTTGVSETVNNSTVDAPNSSAQAQPKMLGLPPKSSEPSGSLANNQTEPNIPSNPSLVNGDNSINETAKRPSEVTLTAELNKRSKITIDSKEKNDPELKPVPPTNNSSQSVEQKPSVVITSSSSSRETPLATNTPPPPVPRPVNELECQWNGCQMKFHRPSDVFYHVHSQHIMIDSCPDYMNCLWGGAEGRGPGCLSKRPKLSLLTHLQDFHCNPIILKQESIRKKQIALMGASNIVLPQPPAHPGYAQNAALLAIRRYTTKTGETTSEPITPQTPLTVSIRLTTALILRNLLKRSHFIKKSLEQFEAQLCEISAAEWRDESRTIAQCLALLNDHK